MSESSIQNFNHLKIHSQYSICEGAVKIDGLQNFSKLNKIKSLALCDTTNLCGALEFAEKISKVGTQPIIGTQINFKYDETTGLLPLFAFNNEGYKRIIKLSSLSFLDNDQLSDPHIKFDDLFNLIEIIDFFGILVCLLPGLGSDSSYVIFSPFMPELLTKLSSVPYANNALH